jgi:hypothetical protein
MVRRRSDLGECSLSRDWSGSAENSTAIYWGFENGWFVTHEKQEYLHRQHNMLCFILDTPHRGRYFHHCVTERFAPESNQKRPVGNTLSHGCMAGANALLRSVRGRRRPLIRLIGRVNRYGCGRLGKRASTRRPPELALQWA